MQGVRGQAGWQQYELGSLGPAWAVKSVSQGQQQGSRRNRKEPHAADKPATRLCLSGTTEGVKPDRGKEDGRSNIRQDSEAKRIGGWEKSWYND